MVLYNKEKMMKNSLKLFFKNFDTRPRKIIQELKTNKPIFKKTEIRGHFGRNVPNFFREIPKNLDY